MSMDRPIEVPQTDPKAGYLAHQAEIDAAIQRVLNSGWYILGPEVQSFEQEFAAYIGVHHAIGVANGTDALELSLRACGVGPGDLVFTVSHTAVATVAAIELAGATPVLVDIDPVTYTMDPNCLEAALAHPPAGTPKAVIPVHLYGHPADMPLILELANRHGLYVIEDCAQSHGATRDGRMTGAWGDIAAFSFYPTKNLGALGDGGAVVTNDFLLAEKVRMLREYGWHERYVSSVPGMNSRLDELQAAVLGVKVRYLQDENEKRALLAKIYNKLLSDSSLDLPITKPNVKHVYHQYAVGSLLRDHLKTFLRAKDVATTVHYPVPVHLQPAYKGQVIIGRGGLKNTEQICNKILSLPMYAQLSDEKVKSVCETIIAWEKENLRNP